MKRHIFAAFLTSLTAIYCPSSSLSQIVITIPETTVTTNPTRGTVTNRILSRPTTWVDQSAGEVTWASVGCALPRLESTFTDGPSLTSHWRKGSDRGIVGLNSGGFNPRAVAIVPEDAEAFRGIFGGLPSGSMMRQVDSDRTHYADEGINLLSTVSDGSRELFAQIEGLAKSGAMPVVVIGHVRVDESGNQYLKLPNGDEVSRDDVHRWAKELGTLSLVLSCHGSDFGLEGREIGYDDALFMWKRAKESGGGGGDGGGDGRGGGGGPGGDSPPDGDDDGEKLKFLRDEYWAFLEMLDADGSDDEEDQVADRILPFIDTMATARWEKGARHVLMSALLPDSVAAAPTDQVKSGEDYSEVPEQYAIWSFPMKRPGRVFHLFALLVSGMALLHYTMWHTHDPPVRFRPQNYEEFRNAMVRSLKYLDRHRLLGVLIAGSTLLMFVSLLLRRQEGALDRIEGADGGRWHIYIFSNFALFLAVLACLVYLTRPGEERIIGSLCHAIGGMVVGSSVIFTLTFLIFFIVTFIGMVIMFLFMLIVSPFAGPPDDIFPSIIILPFWAGFCVGSFCMLFGGYLGVAAGASNRPVHSQVVERFFSA